MSNARRLGCFRYRKNLEKIQKNFFNFKKPIGKIQKLQKAIRERLEKIVKKFFQFQKANRENCQKIVKKISMAAGHIKNDMS